MSGLTISNAHPYLYWGDWGFAPSQAWLHVPRFPDWMTIPGYYSLAKARDWHLLIAWPFALLLLFIWVRMLLNRHFQRDIATKLREWHWRNVWRDVVAHLNLRFDHHQGRYNFLQRVSYGAVFGVFLPMMVLSGIAISPGMEPTFFWLVDLLGGRQSARSLHFIFAFAIAAFVILHVALVLTAGPYRLMKGMITGERTIGRPAS
jgi:thiosulfate reductase cytochrome b subunit